MSLLRAIRCVVVAALVPQCSSTGKGPVGIYAIDARYVVIADSNFNALLVVDAKLGGAVGALSWPLDKNGTRVTAASDPQTWVSLTGVASCPTCGFAYVTSNHGAEFWRVSLPEPLAPLKEPLKGVFKGLAEVAVGAKIDMELELRWDENDEDGLRLLAFSPKQPPINRHPTTGEPAWFCNVHSHSRYLRDRRDGKLVESSGASKLNVTNMFYGDLSEISDEDLQHIDEVTMRNLVPVPMEKGDVVLVDNYQVMHGRDVFTGERMHAVTWFQWAAPAAPAGVSLAHVDTLSTHPCDGTGR